ncbi:MAG: archease, partial [Thermoanaerobaculia bacterium]
MSYRFFDHTADVAVELAAPTRQALFADAMLAFTDTVTDPKTVEPGETHRLEVRAADAEALMIEWLGELVYRFDVDGLLFSGVELSIQEDAEGRLHLVADARGEPYDTEKHPLDVQVKGVTYHQLEVRQEEDGGGWVGRVVFDI